MFALDICCTGCCQHCKTSVQPGIAPGQALHYTCMTIRLLAADDGCVSVSDRSLFGLCGGTSCMRSACAASGACTGASACMGVSTDAPIRSQALLPFMHSTVFMVPCRSKTGLWALARRHRSTSGSSPIRASLPENFRCTLDQPQRLLAC